MKRIFVALVPFFALSHAYAQAPSRVCFNAITTARYLFSSQKTTPEIIKVVLDAATTCESGYAPEDEAVFLRLDQRCVNAYAHEETRFADCQLKAADYVNSTHSIPNEVSAQIDWDQLRLNEETLAYFKGETSLYADLKERCLTGVGQIQDENLLGNCELKAINYVKSLRP